MYFALSGHLPGTRSIRLPSVRWRILAPSFLEPLQRHPPKFLGGATSLLSGDELPLSHPLYVPVNGCREHVEIGRSLTDDPPPDITIALFIVTSLITSYRCFARYRKKLWWHDDSVALVSTLSFIIFLVGSYSICFQRAARQIVETNKFSSPTLGAIYLAEGTYSVTPLTYHQVLSG